LQAEFILVKNLFKISSFLGASGLNIIKIKNKNNLNKKKNGK
jgi:hypothetical protein